MRLGTRAATVVAAVTMLAAAVPAAAGPNTDGQPATAPSRYAAASWRGWMTSAATDRVHDIAQIGDTVYVAGSFTGLRPTRTGTITTQAYLAAFDAVTGAPRTGFRPVLDGVVYSLEPAPDGSRLWIGGNFVNLNGAARSRLAAVDPVTGATLPGYVPAVGGGAIRSLVLSGPMLYLGGNFASVGGLTRTRLAAFDVTTRTISPTWAPTAAGNTVLTLELAPDGSRLYVGGRFTALNGVAAAAWIGALDPTTGALVPAFAARPGREVFDLLADGRGLVWAALGGALGRADVYRAVDGSLLTRHETEGDVEAVEEVGGLIYFGGHDIGPTGWEHVGVVDPAAPSILDAALFDEPSTGGDGVWAFHSTGTDLWLGGNVSGPWFGFTRHPAIASPPARTEVLPVLSTWRYLDTAAAPAGWRTPAFDDSAWRSGAGELGFGDSGEATLLTPGRTTYYFRQRIDVPDPSVLTDLRLDLLADDGAAVYVNGTEVVRANLPTGTLTDTTRASSGLTLNVEDTYRSFPVPASVLVPGLNTVAVEVHQDAPTSSDLSFDARLSAVVTAPPVPDLAPPSTPAGLTSPAQTATTADLSWLPATDDIGVVGYEVLVDGTQVAAPTTTTHQLTGLTPSTSYQVQVRAVDAAGNRSDLSGPVTVTTPAPAPGPVEVVPLGATWRYRDVGTAPTADWVQLGYDDSAWLQGPAVLGREEATQATVLTPGSGVRWFRRTFTVPAAAAVTGMRVELVADDGALVLVNGVEVVRDNLPAGTITTATLAPTYRTGTQERAVRTFTVPASMLVDGTNVVTVQLHQASGSTDASFDLRLTTL